MILQTSTVASKFFFALNTLSVPTVSYIPAMIEQEPQPVQSITSISNFEINPNLHSSTATTTDVRFYFDSVARPTTELEKIIGEVREWTTYSDNWDGEGAYAPSIQSIKDSVAFIKLIDQSTEMPQPSLLATGNVSLFWKMNALYAEIEFIGDNKIAYFIKNNDDKHKGIISFNSQKMPTVFAALVGI